MHLGKNIADLYNELGSSRLSRRLVNNLTFSLLGSITERGLHFIAFILAARMMGTVIFGELGILFSTISMFGVFGGFGLSLTGTKHVAQYKDTDKVKTGKIIGLLELVSVIASLIIGVIVYLNANYVSSHLLHAPHLAKTLQVGSILLASNLLLETQKGILTGYEKFRFILLINLVSGVLTLLLITLGIHWSGVYGAIVGASVASLTTLVLAFILTFLSSRKYSVYLRIEYSKDLVNILFNYSLPAFISGIIVAISLWTMRLLITELDNGYFELGIFSAASRFQTAINLIGITVGNAILPLMSTEKLQSNRRLSIFNIYISWVLGMVPALPIIAFPEIAGLLFGDSFKSELFYKVVVLLMLTTVLMIYKQGLARIIASKDLMWWSSLSNILWAMTLLSATYIMKSEGAFGMSKALLGSYGVNIIFLLPILSYKKMIPKNLMFSNNIAIILAVIAIIALTSFIGSSLTSRAILFPPMIIIVVLQFKKIILSNNYR
jgi:O-antigen/teichoic acid export membrane protein